MSDIAERILQLLDSSDGSVTSSVLASKLGVETQKVVGALKSLQSLGGYIDTAMVSEKRWTLSKEGLEVAEKGSHEAVVYSNVPDVGIGKKELMELTGANGKIGFSKAMSSGWIMIDKADGGIIKKKVESISDTVQSHLKLVQRGDDKALDDKTRNEYKKRKLVEEVIEKIYIVKKGTNFSTTIKKIPTELTAEMIQSGSWKTTQLKDYNLNSMGVVPNAGCLHPLLKVRAEYRQIFLEMGFTEMPTNNYVESSFWNFDALFQPQQHPARDAHDTFFISDPSTTKHFPKSYLEKVKKIHSSGGFGSQGYGYDWKEEEAAKNLLRTHTTAVSARMLYKLANNEGGFEPQKYFSIDKVFRNETLDATHLAEFHQIEGVIADRGLTLGDLIGVLYQFFTKLGIEKLRFKPAYNPYTEPSMEIFSYHEGLGKWVEIGNSGVFRPEMLLPMGLPEDVNVIAWGLSLERPTMIKYGIDNIRDLVGHKVDLDMVQNNPLCRLDKSNDAVERQVDVADRRFDKILEKLAILQQRVNIAAGNNNVALSTTISSSNSSDVIRNVVIHAPASQPPYSLALLLPSLSSSGPCYVSTHIHSSASNSKPSLILNTPTLSRKDCPIKITLIYKDIPEVTTILTPTKSLLGEASLARYLARLAAGQLYEDHPSADLNKIDEILDQLSVSLSSKHAATKLLGSVLEADRRPFLAGAEVTLADVLGLGVAKCHNIATPSVNKWRESCARGGLKI